MTVPTPENRSGNHPGIENNYEQHQQNPGPSEEAVLEKDKNGAAKVLRWIIPVLVIILLIAWLLIKE